jgi:hypothetical protein
MKSKTDVCGLSFFASVAKWAKHACAAEGIQE